MTDDKKYSLKVPSGSSELMVLFRRRARERTGSVTWNNTTLILVYAILAAALIVLRSTGFLVLASAAILGLVPIWIWAKVRARNLEAKFLKDDIQTYMDLVSGPLQNSDSHGAASVPDSPASSPLTVRELQTLRLIAEGKTNKQVAQALHISPRTVKDHVARIFEKLDVGDQTSAILLSMRNGRIRVIVHNE